jgi:hypothetical protein
MHERVVVNKYTVRMWENQADNSIKSKQVLAASEEEAIESERHKPWWYDEGVGRNYRPLLYPLTFTADIVTQ